MKIVLKKPKKKLKLGRVFKKAVAGYKLTRPSATKQAIGAPIQFVPAQFPRPEEERTFKRTEGISLTESVGTLKIKKSDVDLRQINIVYNLIPSETGEPFASAHIRWSHTDSSLIYTVIEPVLTQTEEKLLKEIKTTLIEKLDVDFTSLRKGKAREYLVGKFKEVIQLMAIGLPENRKQYLLYFVERDFIGLGKIEPIMQDPNIEDISCDGVDIPIYIFHRNPVIGSIKSNVFFKTAEELDVFVSKLAQRCGKNVSIASPLVGGSLPDRSRVQATLGTDIARRGSNFTIRKFTRRPLTPIQLVNFKTLDTKIASFLWVAVEFGRSILMSGGVASGKTTLLNALSLFIKPDFKVVSIEDTAELVLPHPHWVPGVARQAMTASEGKKIGEVDMFDLLKESLRQRPDYLIVGEVRGKEAYVLFQQIATGHSSMATIHADSMERLVDRLTTPPINLPASLVEALDIIIFIVKIKYGQNYVRRIKGIYEIEGFDRDRNIPIVNQLFKWNASTDKYDVVNKSIVLKKIADQYGVSEDFIQGEISRRNKVIDWMIEKNILDYIDVAKIIKLYYMRPEDIMDMVS